MSKLSALLLFALLSTSLHIAAQSVSEIKNSKEYYWGEGIEATPKSAEDAALSSLIKSISVNVVSGTFLEKEQTIVNGQREYNEKAQNILKSYSAATLKNTEKLEWEDGEKIHVLCYIKRTEVKKIFAEREAKIKDFVATACKAEENLQIADALKYYYWALLLLQSHPDGNTIVETIDNKSQTLSLYLPQQINQVLDGLKFQVRDKKTEPNLTIYNLVFTYKNQKVSNLEYCAHDGRNWSHVISAKDGIGIAEMAGDKPELHKNIRIRVEYEFGDEWKSDKEVENILSNVNPVPFKKASISSEISATQINDFVVGEPAQALNAPIKPASSETAHATGNKAVSPADGAPYLSMLAKVQNAIQSRQYESARDCFTAEGYDIYQKLVHNGKAVICGRPEYKFIKFDDGILARSLPMRFTFSNRRSFVENIVFDIEDSSGKIRSLSFALNENLNKYVLEQELWSEYSRIAIINFIENYQTAYALKRLDYLQSIFSEDALIIVGRVVRPAGEVENRFIPPKVERTRMSKVTYITHLDQRFKSQEFINLKFADIDIRKAGKGGEMYGIQMQQEYFSTSYGDKGYLFLYVDLNNPYNPIIHVRTWQAEKDPDLGALGVYNLTNF
ncbi:MAG: LPP20 family lipoprotein [Dysgonamonadaceae bacterium]|jgi:hypothetical protein|nr:LPP20 family lipoprotein [Dysgonamonadaceae bacterium]